MSSHASIGGLQVDTSDIERFSRLLMEYAQTARRAPARVAIKKGEDIRVQLYREFWALRMRADVFEEAKVRSAAGRGTLVRLRELSDKFITGAGLTAPTQDSSGRALSRWQQLVWQELERRKLGRGMLGKTFVLVKRQREALRKLSTPPGEHGTEDAVPSLTFGRRHIRVNVSEDGYELSADTSGLSKIGNRYGVLGRAMQNVVSDTEKYLVEHWRTTSRNLLHTHQA